MAEIFVLILTAVLMGMRAVYGAEFYMEKERPFSQIWLNRMLFPACICFAVLYLGIWLLTDGTFFYVRMFDLTASYLILALIDGKRKIVPDSILICMFAGQMLAGVFMQSSYELWHMVWSGTIFGLAAAVVVLLSRGKAGMGDALLLWVTAVTAGWGYTVQILFIGLFLSFLFSICLLAVRRGTLKTELPFVPFLAAGLIVQMVVWGV